MRRVIAGNGADTTSTVQAWLLATVDPLIRHLYIIGPPGGLNTIMFTDHEAPVLYLPYGVFQPAAGITRDKVTAKVGLESSKMAIGWTPNNQSSTVNTATASPFQLAAQHAYDNWPVTILRCFMPTPGDANTYGCTVWWGGRVHTCKVKRNALIFNCADFLDVLDQQLPSTVVEVTNTLASTAALTVPTSPPGVPVFAVFTGSSEDFIIADCLSPTPNNIYSGNLFAGGYMVFLPGAGATLAGFWSAVGQNGEFTDGDGNHHSEFEIYTPLPWPPTPTVDTFYVSMAPPGNLDGSFGFYYVPAPQSAA